MKPQRTLVKFKATGLLESIESAQKYSGPLAQMMIESH